MKLQTSATTPSHGTSPLLKAARAAFGAAALTSVLALTSGCVVAVRPAPVAVEYSEPGEVVVDTAPPPPVYETVGIAPGPGYFWIGGYYHWSGARWVWNRGHYARPPHPGAAWIGPRYAVRGGRNVYIRGYWR
jgi:hypothetical protein